MRSEDLPKFELGRIVATPSVLAILTEGELTPLLARHVTCDWGDLPEEDVEVNRLALEEDQRLMSNYLVHVTGSSQLQQIWIITEADRSITTVLLPDDY